MMRNSAQKTGENRDVSQLLLAAVMVSGLSGCGSSSASYTSAAETVSEVPAGQTVLPDTNQHKCYDVAGSDVNCSGTGQDGAYVKNTPSYTLADGVVTDNVTGLMWQQDADTNDDNTIDVNDKLTQNEAVSYCSALSLGGYDDWRLPDITTLYSLIDFSGEDISAAGSSTYVPFIDTNYFIFAYGDTSAGEREIDSQWATTSTYVSTVMDWQSAMFGVNFADGRIKGYPTTSSFYVRCVRGNTYYGQNRFEAEVNGTVNDLATGLMWKQNDSGTPLSWSDAISYCENDTTGGHTDWRLPDAKALQSLVDYTRSPDTANSAAIDTDYFNASSFINEDGATDYGFYWSSTTHIKSGGNGDSAVYVSFGRALGYMLGEWMDVHGAGAQRSDPKSAAAMDDMYVTVDAYGGTAISHGPQGDVIRLENFARCVRDISE